MGKIGVIAAGAALSAFSGQAQHNRLMRLDFPFEDGPPAKANRDSVDSQHGRAPTRFSWRTEGGWEGCS